MRPDVSFLMPCATPAPFLRATLTSLASQTVDSWELVLVLDGDAPSEAAVARDLTPPGKLRLIQMGSRGGIARALNLGLHHCSAPFVARIDADDICAPERLEVQLNAMQSNPQYRLLGSRAERIDEGGRVTGVVPIKVEPDSRRSLLRKNQFVHSAAFFRTADVVALGGYNVFCHLREDYELWLRLAIGGPLANVPETLVQYRISAGQSSRAPASRRATQLIGTSRAAAAEAIGVSNLEAKAYQFAWTVGQTRMARSLREAKRAQ